MNKIGIYLHIPFCKAKCAYCDFYSVSRLSCISEYEAVLCRSIKASAPALSGRKLDTLYIGGGTPSLLSEKGLQDVFSALHRVIPFSPEAEITVEMNPESVSRSLLMCAKENGVNRLSFGMQTALDAELCAIGRLHRHADTCRAVEMAREVGFSNLSLDLMYGLPGQTLSTFRESLKACLDLSPQHISFYCLTLSESAPLYQKRGILPGEEEVREMYLFAHDFLEKAGFEHYEISNAALPGFRSRHNEGYWLGREYLGIGPGAHSFFDGARFSMSEDLDRFLQALSPFDTVDFREEGSPSDRRTEYVMLSLRRKEGIDLKKLLSLSNEAFCRKAEEKLRLWSEHGLCRKTPQGYALTPEGFFVSNEMISELI